jgi:hypothetical protein
MAMKLWLILIVSFLFFQSMARAESLYTTVFNVFEAVKTQRILILSAADGRIYKTQKTEESLIQMKALVGQVVKLDYTLNGTEAFITAIRPVRAGEVNPQVMDLNHFQYNQLRAFAPTDLKTFEAADSVFKNMLNDGDKNRSQCFKRAHMWSFDMWSQLGINSEKLYIFWTQRFQAIDDYDWWFHVTPVVTVNGEKFAMDGTFMKKPTPINEWKNFFMKTDKITCPVITNYKQYEGNQWNRLCYLMLTPMYYFSPLNIKNRDKSNEKRNNWVLEEIQDARRAFKNYEEVYEGFDNGGKTIKF